jgi:hypothetical protein
MTFLHWIGIVYFVALFALVNWKGKAFLDLPLLARSVIALVAGGLWAGWIIALHLTS